MSDIVDELAKVLAAQATNAINREVAQAVLDSGLVIPQTSTVTHQALLQAAAQRDEARAEVKRLRNGPDHTYRCAFLTRAENAEVEVERLNTELAERDAKTTEARRLIRDFAGGLIKRGWPVAKHGREMLRRLDGGAS